MTLSESALAAIRDAVGPKGWSTDGREIAPHLVEERGLWRGTAAMLVRPASTDEVAAVVRVCAEAGIPIVPQGGNTGLVGGGVPDGGIVLSTARLDRIRAVDSVNHTITVEAGCILARVQEAAAEAGALFPLSLTSEGSCRIGGNLATNAGGVHVLRYGSARELALGLEVVLADGRIWDGLRALRKDNAGYDLKQLFIGSEGTLGVITAAVLKLFPGPKARETALAAAPSLEALCQMFLRAREVLGAALAAFEMFSRTGVDFGLRHVPGVIDPFAARHRYYGLLELSGVGAEEPLRDSLESLLAGALEDGLIDDAVIAASEAQAAELWRIREAIPEAQKHEGGSIKHDVSVPLSEIARFVARASQAVERELPGIRVCDFGHLGDGNIHFNLSQPEGMERQAFLDLWGRFNRLIHDLAVEMGGSFAAEHGIGRLKREDLKRYRSPVEVGLMRTLKGALDPKNIMNPGKVVDPD